MAAAHSVGLVDLIIQIDQQRTSSNLSSAVRTAVLGFYQLSASSNASPVTSGN